MKRPPLAVAGNAVLASVLAPESFRRLKQKAVYVGRHFQIGQGAADLEHAAAPPLARHIVRHPDHLDEEVAREKARQHMLGRFDAAAGPAQVAKGETLGRPSHSLIDVVLEHQSLRRVHGGLGLVQVGALGQGQQARDPAQHRIALACRRLRQPTRRRIKAMLSTQILEGRAVRTLVVDAHDLVDELVRDLVLEHLAHHTQGC